MKSLKPPLVHKVVGSQPGPELAIIVGVHGNEKGPQLEWDWLKSLKIHKGILHLVFANPTAADDNVRYLNVNLNRRFGKGLRDYPEDSIARQIEAILDRCEAALDLHMYNETMDRPFAICNTRSNHIAGILPAQYIVNLSDDEAGGTDDYMSANGKVGICFEVGSVERPDAYSDQIREAVNRFLGYYEAILYPGQNDAKPLVLNQIHTKFVERKDIRFTKEYESFDALKKDELICVENGIEFRAPSEGYILFPRPNNPVGAEAYYILSADLSDKT